jgi:hypothetical protein
MIETIKSTDSLIKEAIQNIFEEKGIKRPVNQDYGKALTEFYMWEIGQHIYKIYEDDIETGLECDGKGDLNVDFAHHYIDENSFLIIQSKYKGNKSSVDSDELSGFFNIHERIIDRQYLNEHGNQAVRNELSEINDNSTFNYVFLTNDKFTNWLSSEFARLKSSKESLFENVTFSYVSITEIKRELTEVKSMGEVIPQEVEIFIENITDTIVNKKRHSYLDLSTVVDTEGHYKSILCTIKGSQLKNLYRQHGNTLFNYNIRGWLGENDINKKVKKTLEDEPEKFYFYNNGISAICTGYEPVFNSENEISKIKFKDFQIINGAQTTTTIGKFRDDGKLTRVRVLLKITKTESLKKEKKGLNKNIITFNNSQTVIKASDFRSNDEIQGFLANQLSQFTYRGCNPYKQISYLPKRVKIDSKRKDKLYISIDTLARILYVFYYDPITIFKGTRTLFDTDETTGKYWSVFGEENKEVGFFSPSKMNEVVGIIFLWTKLEEILKRSLKEKRSLGKETSIDYQALLAKWHFLWAYSEIINRLYFHQKSQIWKRLIDSKNLDTRDNFIEIWFKRIYRTIAEVIEDNYQKEKTEREQQDKTNDEKDIQGFNFKNWLRNQSSFDILKSRFKRIDQEDYSLQSKV